MNILAIETAASACSVALAYDEHILIRETSTPRQQSKILLQFIDQLLAEAGLAKNQLSGIAWSAGPGSFTGLRIGAGVVAGLAFALQLPVVAVSTLAVMAQRAYDEHQITASLVALDARMAEVYWGAYQLNQADGLVEALTQQDMVAAPAELVLPAEIIQAPQLWAGIGCGFSEYHNELQDVTHIQSIRSEVTPHALQVLKLARPSLLVGDVQSADQVIPVYCRNDVAHRT